MNKFNQYYQAVKFLEGLSNLPRMRKVSPQQLENQIKRTRHLLNLVGKPDKGIKFIHVTGTSGKGSVSAAIHAALVKSGQKTGLFTSPYVTTSIEKIKVNDLYIAPEQFAQLVNQVKPALNAMANKSPYGTPTYFETLFAIALLYFKQRKCRWAVLEVGMGGRYDATNAITKSEIAVITNIDLDHIELLGRTLKKIAGEKLGIIKKGSRVFTSESRPHLLELFKQECQKVGASLYPIAPSGDYKTANNKLALAVTRALKIPDAAAQAAMVSVKLPARFEVVKHRPTIIVDGAHNVAKIRSTVSSLKTRKYGKLILILALVGTKDAEGIVSIAAPIADTIICTHFQKADRRCTDPALLAGYAKKRNQKAKVISYVDSREALDYALKIAHSNDLILITGSFYLAGELRTRWFPEERILQTRQSF